MDKMQWNWRGNGFMGLQWIWRVECNGFGDGWDGINAMDLEVMDIVTKNHKNVLMNIMGSVIFCQPHG